MKYQRPGCEPRRAPAARARAAASAANRPSGSQLHASTKRHESATMREKSASTEDLGEQIVATLPGRLQQHHIVRHVRHVGLPSMSARQARRKGLNNTRRMLSVCRTLRARMRVSSRRLSMSVRTTGSGRRRQHAARRGPHSPAHTRTANATRINARGTRATCSSLRSRSLVPARESTMIERVIRNTCHSVAKSLLPADNEPAGVMSFEEETVFGAKPTDKNAGQSC